MRGNSPRELLLIDDQPAQAGLVAALAARAGWKVMRAADPAAAVKLIASTEARIGAALVDLWTPDSRATDGVAALHAACPALPIIVTTAQDSSELAVRAMRCGAVDIIVKPVVAERLATALNNAASIPAEACELRPLTEKWAEDLDFAGMIGTAPAFRRAVGIAMRAAETQASILIEGESGVGKEVLAQAIHRGSACAAGPLVTVNCGAIPANLIESELFGHEKGAFTGAFERRLGHFANADGGTIFLDEIGDLPLEAQVKLLRVLQSGEIQPIGAQSVRKVSVRVIAATNRRLSDDVVRGRFREDLFYRLAVVPVTLPPLRDRPGDMPALVEHLLDRIARQLSQPKIAIDQAAIEVLSNFDWPGNVRQLQNVLFRAAIFSVDGRLGAADFPNIALGMPSAPAAKPLAGVQPITIKPPTGSLSLFGPDGHVRPIEEIEAEMIRLAIGHYRGRMTEVARRLQIGRSTLYRKLGELGIDHAH